MRCLQDLNVVASGMMSMFSGSQNFISAFISAIRKSAGLGYLLMYEENSDVGLKAAFSGSSPAVAEGTRPDLHMIVEGRRIGIGGRQGKSHSPCVLSGCMCSSSLLLCTSTGAVS